MEPSGRRGRCHREARRGLVDRESRRELCVADALEMATAPGRDASGVRITYSGNWANRAVTVHGALDLEPGLSQGVAAPVPRWDNAMARTLSV